MRIPALVPLALLLAACPKPPANDPDAAVPYAQAPTWANWSQNLVHAPPTDGVNYYFSPVSRAQLAELIESAPDDGSVTLRVSGGRHAQPPLVADDNRGAVPAQATTWLIDLSCYADLGPGRASRMVLDADKKQVTVNTGVREDELDAFLTANNLMLQTVTAGGFFSLGGMTAVDVHGAAIDAPIFAETAVAFEIMGPDGEVTRIDADTPAVDGIPPLQHARVSLGALGVVTSVTLAVEERPWATTLHGGLETHKLRDQEAFVSRYKDLLARHDRIESFYNPYNRHFLMLWWDEVADPEYKKPNEAPSVADACTYAEKGMFGAPYEAKVIEPGAEGLEEVAQRGKDRGAADLLIGTAMDVIREQASQAQARSSDLWLQEAARVIFMSYFIELPAADEAGLAKVWAGLDAINQRIEADDSFLLAGPLEFRFIRGGQSSMSGTWTENPGSLFVNLDLIGFVKAEPAADYPPELLAFFADLERTWVGLGGVPHGGKMYGFYDPAAPETATAPFNPAYLAELARKRGARQQAFEAYRASRDPNGVFCNDFLDQMLGCKAE
jgi:FAD/FMN-containing dehydrogenase